MCARSATLSGKDLTSVPWGPAESYPAGVPALCFPYPQDFQEKPEIGGGSCDHPTFYTLARNSDFVKTFRPGASEGETRVSHEMQEELAVLVPTGASPLPTSQAPP